MQNLVFSCQLDLLKPCIILCKKKCSFFWISNCKENIKTRKLFPSIRIVLIRGVDTIFVGNSE